MQPHIHNHKLSAAVERVEGGRAAGSKSEQHTYLPRRDLALAYSALPCAVLPPTAQNPVTLSSLRAIFTASPHFFSALFAKFCLARADAALLTILPDLLFVNVALPRPPTVFSFFPRKTRNLAILPFA